MRLAEVEAALERAPRFRGRPLRVHFRDLKLCDGAASIPDRFIVLDRGLSRAALRRVLIHELFHFVWVRLGNPARWSWEQVLQREFRERARGELGFSAEWRRDALPPSALARRDRRWREYVCESFCDTAAFLYAGSSNADRILAPRFRARRFAWFREFPGGFRI